MEIDFCALDESLDGAIRRAMEAIRPKVMVGEGGDGGGLY